jgi:hypothetical protein
MALSKDEQRTLDEIEHGLRAEDPRFVDTVNFDHIRPSPGDRRQFNVPSGNDSTNPW